MPTPKEPPLPEELQARLTELMNNNTNKNNDDHANTTTSEDWRALGNECFKLGCHLPAIKCYTKALEKLEPNDSALLRSNRSAAYLKSFMFAGPALALKDAERAVELESDWFKAHLRVGDAQFARQKYKEAKIAYEKALELNHNCTAAKESLRLVERELFLRSLDEQAKQKEKQEKEQREQFPSKGTTSDWSANSTMSGINPMTPSTKSNNEIPLTSEEEIGRDIQLWTQDTTIREDRTAMKAFNASVEEADREAGVNYKQTLLSQFRSKLDTQAPLRRTVEERREQELRKGEGIDYRNAETYRAMLMHGTDGVGLGISTDAYKSYKYESKMW